MLRIMNLWCCSKPRNPAGDFSLLDRTILLNLLPNICAGSLEIGRTNKIAEYFKQKNKLFQENTV